jgi:hypothetical protein
VIDIETWQKTAIHMKYNLMPFKIALRTTWFIVAVVLGSSFAAALSAVTESNSIAMMETMINKA